ncbi:MAG: DUF2973 domain-containing protein [Oscillatoria sp. PMC 1051.18]|uniref:DUF2973 domain-containing protein n=1 Tax=Oscillatoria salina TaxID=331517 RepID=UPI0013B64C4C|nr:DUF2973 domain-containing protein [Oscillatoria salina]MBZ8179489.1 DUF2973 domain-containing protein [Oscillatoria salina IIICB1]MEC4895654.1 DUF2973 domain-containing protein [Oscillatoria sp. PMC 1050.18]MEC5032399.1 DUF2973 domain-containing protein [Oscillatoria sp. PMC 1051.18]NET88529.1 DUF2973 domain-containing protein [Kamptonema sp. SIO1D9]
MLHLLYILAFTIIAFLAVSNLIRSLITLSGDSSRSYQSGRNPSTFGNNNFGNSLAAPSRVPHPELLDATGKPIDEPLLVMRSVSVEDARQQLDSIYNSSPSNSKAETEE